MSELKPCPFCGSKKIRESVDGTLDFNNCLWYCEDCGADGPNNNSIDESLNAWNRRASPWVRIEDRLPEHCQDVLIKLVCCGDAIISATWHGIYNHFFSNVSGHDYPDATHWMLIPEIEG